jgi:hypothetical protein
MKNTTIPGNPIGNRRNEGKIDTPGIHDHSENTPGIHDHSGEYPRYTWPLGRIPQVYMTTRENTPGIHDHSGECIHDHSETILKSVLFL